MKARLWQALLKCVFFDPAFYIVVSMPVPNCRFAKIKRRRRFWEVSALGYDEVAR